MIPEHLKKRKYYKHIIKEVFNSKNLLINLSNIVIFLIFIILFFWFILSRQFDYIVLDKVNIISLLAKYDKDFNETLTEYLNTNESLYEIPKKALEQEESRNAYNFILLQTEVFPFLYVVCTSLIIVILYIIVKRKKLLKAEYYLLSFVVFAFITEVIFYFLVIKEWQFIGDYQLLYNVLK